MSNSEVLSAQLHAIKKFAYFRYNYPRPKEMCETIWGKGCMGDHMWDKLKSCNFDMGRFYVELSSDNQEKFAEYILKNYHGVR